MVSPYLTKKKEESLSLEHSIRKLFQVIYKEQHKEEKVNEDEARIKVSDLISKMAFYYEKIRNAVDYNEEHLHRKDAILRILKRQIVIEGLVKENKNEELASSLLVELIRAGYLPNNRVPESKIDEVAEVIEKHIRLRNSILPKFGGIGDISRQVEKVITKEKREIGGWLLGLMASEIESILEKDKVKEIVVSNMYEYLVDNIKLPTNFSEYEKDRELQVYLAIFRNYMKFDRDMLAFIVFKYYHAEWWMPKDNDISAIAQNINVLRKAIDHQLDHPLAKQLNKHIGRYTIYYQVLVDMISEDPAKLYETIKIKPDKFPALVRGAFTKRYEAARKKLWRAGMNSIFYILVAKIIFAIALEFPVMNFIGKNWNAMSQAVNILFPPLFLFFVIIFTRVSSEENTKKVIQGVSEITFVEKKRTEPIVLRKPAGRNHVLGSIFNLVYGVTYLISFGAIIYVLNKLDFTWITMSGFLLFLALLSFFSIRIRRNVRQMIIVEEKENIFSFIIDFFFVPIISVGKWLSAKFSHLNVFVFVLDFIIEAPFKVLVGIAEEWTKYVRERKEDIV
ncbi:hypothetical protein GF382_01735 [Candidatus Falkowbacteria bacterium]|nr:hypothetical protein [Candidatus Falkowbacteria bacterium]